MLLTANMSSPPLRRIARVLAVLAIAMAAGHLVQSLAARKPVAQKQAAVGTPTRIVQLSAGTDEALPAPLIQPRGPTPQYLVAAPAVPISPPTPACFTALNLHDAPGAMIAVALTASCHKGERVVLHHSGLAVTGRTDAAGTFSISVPALVTAATVEVRFGDGSQAAGDVAVPELAGLRRFGIQWQGGQDFEVHGLENGADYGQSGDIARANPGSVGTTHGLLTVLGDAAVANPLLAQIFTYSADPTVRSNVVVEAAITSDTCGHDQLAETLTSANGASDSSELTLAMPDCSAIGDFLVLNNLTSDTKVAAN